MSSTLECPRVQAVVAVAEHFTKRRCLAMGMTVCGTGLGTCLLAPAELELVRGPGWRWGLVGLAGLCLLCTAAGAVMAPPTSPPSPPPSPTSPGRGGASRGGRGWCHSLLSLLLSPELLASPALPAYCLLALADTTATLALFTPFTFLPDLGTFHKPWYGWLLMSCCSGYPGSVARPGGAAAVWCRGLQLSRPAAGGGAVRALGPPHHHRARRGRGSHPRACATSRISLASLPRPRLLFRQLSNMMQMKIKRKIKKIKLVHSTRLVSDV